MRSLIGTALQDSVLLSGSVRENIVLERPGVDDTEMLRVSELKSVGQMTAAGYPKRGATDVRRRASVASMPSAAERRSGASVEPAARSGPGKGWLSADRAGSLCARYVSSARRRRDPSALASGRCVALPSLPRRLLEHANLLVCGGQAIFFTVGDCSKTPRPVLVEQCMCAPLDDFTPGVRATTLSVGLSCCEPKTSQVGQDRRVPRTIANSQSPIPMGMPPPSRAPFSEDRPARHRHVRLRWAIVAVPENSAVVLGG